MGDLGAGLITGLLKGEFGSVTSTSILIRSFYDYFALSYCVIALPVGFVSTEVGESFLA